MTHYFFITSSSSTPLFESFTPNTNSKLFILQFVGYSALDIIDQTVLTSTDLFSFQLDSFEEYFVSCFVSVTGMRFVLVHENQFSESLVKDCFLKSSEVVIRAMMNPFFSEERFPATSELSVKLEAVLKMLNA